MWKATAYMSKYFPVRENNPELGFLAFAAGFVVLFSSCCN